MMADRIIFACTLVLAAVYFYATAQIPSLEIGDPLGPKAFPRLLGIGLLITAGMLFMEMRRARKTAMPGSEHAQPGNRRHFAIVAAAVVWTGLYFAVFEWLGYAIATAVYLLALMAYFNRGKWTANVLTSVLFSFISYFMFTRLLGVMLAPGMLPF